MGKRYIITLTAANRTGILAAVTNALDELGGNMLEVSQTVIQGFFTIMLSADFPEHRSPEVIVDHIRDIGRPFGMEVTLKDPATETAQRACEGSQTYLLMLTGSDQPGIIRRMTHRLVHEGVDISDLYAMRHAREDRFTALLELEIPSGADFESLERDLTRIGDEMGVQVVLQPELQFAATYGSPDIRLSMREWVRSQAARAEDKKN